MKLVKLSACAVVALTVAACAGGSTEMTPLGQPLPDGAIRVGVDMYQTPQGRDDDGCAVYRLFSRKSEVSSTNYYRTKTGTFTTDKKKAVCEDK